MEENVQHGEQRPGGQSIRVSGKFYSIEKLIDGAINHTVSPSNLERIFASLLFIILFIAVSVAGYNLGGFGVLVATLVIHEAGHWLGMILVGWSKVSFGFDLLGPVVWATEDLSAGRKATVALSGPALGLIASMSANLCGGAGNTAFLQDLSHALFFITLLNLLPIKPFDGYTVVEHLVFVRYPRLEMFYLGLSGVVLFVFSVRLFYANHDTIRNDFWAVLMQFYCFTMFYGIKKIDNMADIVVRLRRDAKHDFEAGRYSVKSVKKMEFSLAMFDLQNESSASILLRELWDKAREVPPSRVEALFVLAMYALLVISCAHSGAVREIIERVFHIIGL